MLERITRLLVLIQQFFPVFLLEEAGTDYFVRASQVSPEVCSQQDSTNRPYQQGMLQAGIPQPDENQGEVR